MKRFLLFLLLVSVARADIITLTITETNLPSNNDFLTINGASRTNKTAVAVPALEVLIGASIGANVTNWFNQTASFLYPGPLFPTILATNQWSLRAREGQTITATASGTWCTLTLSTQSTTSLIPVRVPISGEPSTAIKTNIASQLIKGMFNDGFANNTVDATSPPLANFVNVSESQSVTGEKTFTAQVNVNQGAVFTATATNTLVFQMQDDGDMEKRFAMDVSGGIFSGLGAVAPTELYRFTSEDTFTNRIATWLDITNRITALKAAANTWSGINTFGPLTSTHIYGSTLSNIVGRGTFTWYKEDTSNLELGGTVQSGDSDSVALGNGSSVTESQGTALGEGSTVAHNGSTAVGNGATTTASDQVMLGIPAGGNGKVAAPANLFVENNILIGDADLGPLDFPTSLAKGRFMLNGTAPSADPSGGFADWSGSGEWKYRSGVASEGSGGENRVHNRTIFVIGSGTDFTVPDTSFNRVDFGTTDVQADLPTAGTYTITAIIALVNGASANDLYLAKFYNSTDAADVIPGSVVSNCDASQILQIHLQTVLTVSSAKTIQLYLRNVSGARGSVEADDTSIIAVRQF